MQEKMFFIFAKLFLQHTKKPGCSKNDTTYPSLNIKNLQKFCAEMTKIEMILENEFV